MRFVIVPFALLFTLGLAYSLAPMPKAPTKEEAAKAELEKLNGTWQVVSMKFAGMEFIKDGDESHVIKFKNGAFEWENSGGSGSIAAIDPTKDPREVDYTYNGEGPLKGKTQKAIYKLDGDTFVDCFGSADADRPTKFESTRDNGLTVIVYKRVKKID